MNRAILTLAMNSPSYFKMAISLFRSIKQTSESNKASLHLVTDLQLKMPADCCDVKVVRVGKGEIGEGFSSKLYLDKLAPAEKTLFIDADCLCFRDLEPVWRAFQGRPVSVVGGEISTGEWFGDVASTLKKVGLTSIPKFNGGLYYLEKGATCTEIYDSARKLLPAYDEIGLVRLRGKPNDELLMALAMGRHSMKAIPEDGTIMGDLYSCPGTPTLDIFRGIAELCNPPPPFESHRDWFPFEEISPAIVHFLGGKDREWPYRVEAVKLALARKFGLPHFAANLLANASTRLPGISVEILKNLLRPCYRRLIGSRRVLCSRP